MLAALKKHGITAVGLVAWGDLPATDVALLERWMKAGHELGNHSSTHLSYTTTEPERFFEDVEAAREKIAALTKRPVRFFRFPFLNEGNTLAKLEAGRGYLKKSGQRNLPVTIDDQDWSFEEPFLKKEPLVKDDYHAMMRLRVETTEQRGDKLLGRTSPQILLLHAGAVGASEWDRLFSWLESTGHRFATADEVLADAVFAESHVFVGDNGPGLYDRLRDRDQRAIAASSVAELLAAQAKAWNDGDVDRFCSVYADDAIFLSPSGVTRGRQAVIDRYKKRYPTKALMGTLALKVIDVRVAKGLEYTPHGDAVPSRVHAVSVAAEWTISFPDKPAARGTTLLTLHPRGDSYAIVQDASL